MSIILAAIAVRLLLSPWLGNRLPYITLIVGVVVAVGFCRWRAATAAAAIGFVIVSTLLVAPRSGFSFSAPWLVGSSAFAVLSAAVIFLGEKLHRSREQVQRELNERRLREHSLMEQTRQLQEAQQLSHIGSWHWDARSDAASGSEELYRIFGLNPATDPLPSFTGQRGTFYPVAAWEKLNLAVQDTLKSGVGYTLELEGLCAGKKIWVTTRGERVTDADGKIVGLRGTVQDITERKAAEEALRLSSQRIEIVKDVAEVGFWFCDLPFGTLEWDSVVKEHFWLSPDASVDIDLFYKRLHPDDRERTRRRIEHSIASKERFEIDYRTVRPQDGRIKWIRAIGCSFYDDDGTPTRFDGATFDITESRRVETVLRESENAARAASAAKDAFIAQLSHELRTPLTPVLMTACALQEDVSLSDDVRQQLRMIERNISLESRLIDDLLDITRITHGKLSLRSEPCNVHSLLFHVVEMVQDEAREKHVRVSLELQALQTQLHGDSTRLQQVFWNILRNAVKFSPEDGVVIIRSRNLSSPSGSSTTLCIEIEDQGVGFDAEVKARMFEPFEQGAASRDSRFAGLGLGLAITKAVVTLHGGTVDARSEGPGFGACFTVCLPDATQEAPVPQQEGGGGTPNITQLDVPLRLLLVEDHEPSLQVLSRLLARAGHSVVGVSTKADALEQACRTEFDGVISDLGLPDGTGHELMHLLRERRGLKGIALSGYGTEADQQNSRDAGFIAHLIKPVVFAELNRALQALARR
ncbi:ATP-binding protein [Prosthecobacter sp.]|uniref:hybrid sensor histidine kinase/response regulator n=1 Tax=Prosthecobacter sp. TaxID=1965333 RepID=UPI003785263D